MQAQGILEGPRLNHAEPGAQVQLKSLFFAACMQYACSSATAIGILVILVSAGISVWVSLCAALAERAACCTSERACSNGLIAGRRRCESERGEGRGSRLLSFGDSSTGLALQFTVLSPHEYLERPTRERNNGMFPVIAGSRSELSTMQAQEKDADAKTVSAIASRRLSGDILV